MDIYTEDGELDYVKAQAEARSTDSYSSTPRAAIKLDIVKTAALVDIASSLNVLALEVSLKMQRGGEYVTDEQGDDLGGQRIDVGDTVRLAEDISQNPDRPTGTVLSFGETEGAEFAVVEWTDNLTAKAWVQDLELVPDLDAVDELTADAEANNRPELGGSPVPSAFDDYSLDRVGESEAALEELARETPDPADAVDDIDSDFDGDKHTAHHDGLAALRAAEAKPAKPKAKKKGK